MCEVGHIWGTALLATWAVVLKLRIAFIAFIYVLMLFYVVTSSPHNNVVQLGCLAFKFSQFRWMYAPTPHWETTWTPELTNAS